MPGRQYNNGSYRYGFNGKENDNEVKGTGNQQDYGMRIYDTRLGRFLSVDPIASDYPFLTTYQFASNTPIQAIDLDGLEKIYYLGAFSKTGKSTLISLVNKTKIYKEAVTNFQDATKNSKKDLILIEGVTGRNEGETIGMSNSELREALSSDDQVEAIYKNTFEKIPKEKINDQFINALAETAEAGKDMTMVVITQNRVEEADSKNYGIRATARPSAANTLIHEMVAHVNENLNEPGTAHQKYYGSRDSKGNLINGGKDCECEFASPHAADAKPTSNGGRANREVKEAIKNENSKK